MLSDACLRFRDEYPEGDSEGHSDRCAPCQEWARDVASLRAAGTDLPLPAALRARSLALNDRGVPSGARLSPALLPQVPLPPDLMARLYRIPVESRLAGIRNHPPAGSGELVAASLLFATLLTFGLGSFLTPVDRPKLGAASRIAGAVLKEAGNRGTQTILGAGEGIFDGCIEASRKLGDLLGHIGDPWWGSRTDQRVPEASPKTTPTSPQQRKENTHGSSPTH